MGALDKYFIASVDEVHPQAAAWLERIDQGQKATFRLWRKRDGLVFKPAEIYMTFETPNGSSVEHHEWDEEINEPLVRAGVKAEDLKNEAQRLELMLHHWFTEPSERLGPGFFDAVLVEVLKGPEFSEMAQLSEVVGAISRGPAHQGSSYRECKQAVDSIIKRAGHSLTEYLKYDLLHAKLIVSAALAQYVDERFHITDRKLLGLG